MSRLGLRSRVVVPSVLVLVIGITGIGVAINVLLTNRLTADATSVLSARVSAQLATVVRLGNRVAVRVGPSDRAFDREAWVFAGGTEIARPDASSTAERAARSLAGVGSRTMRDAAGGAIRLLAEPVRDDRGRQYATVVMGVTLEPYEHSERIARYGTLALGLFVILAGALIAWRAVGAGLRPVAEMARVAEDYGEHDLGGRFAMGPPRDELTSLAATLDGLLGRLQASLRHEQRLSAEIAHELRTPLSGLRAEAEFGLRAGEPEAMSEALRSAIDGADRMNGVIDALLRASRLPDAAAATCRIGDAVAQALAGVSGLATECGIALRASDGGGDLLVGAEAALVAQTLNPLLENAIRHAEAVVRVAVEPSGEMVRVVVFDDGPGLPPGDQGALFEPGVSTAGGSGAGIGLALARRLARSIGGDVYTDAPNAGARLVVELPRVGGAPG